MRCKYIYTENDRDVKKKKRTVGDQCPSMIATEGLGGYCSGHAKKMGCIPSEILREREARQREKLRETWEKKKAAGQHQLGENKPWSKSRVMDGSGEPEVFNLKEEYRVYKSLNINPTGDLWDEKVCFSRWLASSEDCRKPKKIDDVAEILGVHVTTLHKWKRNRSVVGLVNAENEVNFHTEADALSREAILQGLRRKDMKAVELYVKHYKPDDGKKQPEAQQIPQGLLDLAGRLAGDVGGELKGEAKKSNERIMLQQELDGEIKQ